MATEPRQATTVYLSYAQQDKALKQELENHLAVLRQTGQISLGGEREIQPGTDWAQTIDPRLSTADIVLLLLSADLLGSGYCSVAEVRQAQGGKSISDSNGPASCRCDRTADQRVPMLARG